MRTKKFDKKLYAENDKIARTKVKEFLKPYFDEIKDNPDKYGADLTLTKDGVFYGYAECEIKRVWSGRNFPYESVQFPHRKNKYILPNCETLFCMLNNETDTILIVKSTDLKASKIVEVPNKFLDRQEFFFQVSLDYVLITVLQEEV